MWNRPGLKNKAKGFLRQHYWQAFLVALIMVFAWNEGSWVAGFRIVNPYEHSLLGGGDLPPGQVAIMLKGLFWDFLKIFHILPLFTVSYQTIGIISGSIFVLGIFVFNPLMVGGKRYFIESNRRSNEGSKGEIDLSVLGFAFAKDTYFNVVKIMFLMQLYLLLWSLLLIIPGVVKGYAYWLIPYYLAENPGMDLQEIFRKSIDTTEGHKWNMFVLDLSFLGWELLGMFLLGIGGIFVVPYTESTLAQLYLWFEGEEKEEEDLPDCLPENPYTLPE